MLSELHQFTNIELSFLIVFVWLVGVIMGFVLHNAIEAHEEERQAMLKEQRPMAERRED